MSPQVCLSSMATVLQN